VRRTLGIVLLCSSLALIAAAPPSPKPAPVPKASPSFVPSAAPPPATVTPTVVVYPFETPTDVDARTGGAIAQIYSQVMTQAGGLNVLPIPQNIKREDWAKYAHSQRADYYVSGYVQPIGQGAAIVARVVDASSEIAVYSATTQIESVPDIASQALTARTVVLQASGVSRPDVTTTTDATATPSGSGQGASYKVGNVLDSVSSLFKRGGKSVAAGPTATSAVKPAMSVIVARLSGNASAGDISETTDDLFRAMNEYYKTSMTRASATNLAKEANGICGTNRRNTIASGVLNSTRSGGLHPHNSYTFTLNVYTCFGSVLYTNTQTNDNKRQAINDAVAAYVKDHPENT
jgi:TolB-like protein